MRGRCSTGLVWSDRSGLVWSGLYSHSLRGHPSVCHHPAGEPASPERQRAHTHTQHSTAQHNTAQHSTAQHSMYITYNPHMHDSTTFIISYHGADHTPSQSVSQPVSPLIHYSSFIIHHCACEQCPHQHQCPHTHQRLFHGPIRVRVQENHCLLLPEPSQHQYQCTAGGPGGKGAREAREGAGRGEERRREKKKKRRIHDIHYCWQPAPFGAQTGPAAETSNSLTL